MIDIKNTTQQHQGIAKHLLAAHALTGCDTVSYMFGLGKLTMLKTLNKHHPLQLMGQRDSDMDGVITEASKFITACYGCKPQHNMSDTRYAVWKHRLANVKASAAPLLKSLPPTTEAFSEHVHRAHYQAFVWMSAAFPDPPDMDPTDYGWTGSEAITIRPRMLA